MSSARSLLTASLRHLRSALGGSAVILTYHRVADDVFDPHKLAVSTATFSAHVSAFAKRYELLDVRTILHSLAAHRRLPRHAVAITFDDGYADTLTNAYPILRSHGAPATLFVSTASLSSGREFWWDELEQLVLTADLPERLALPASAGLGETLELAPEDRAPLESDVLAGWDVTQPAPDLRRRIFTALSGGLATLAVAQRDAAMELLRSQVEASPAVRPEKRALTREELATLAADGLVEIGAHTVNHVSLAQIPAEEQRDEIVGGKRTLEEILGTAVESFSYPHGIEGSFTRETQRIVREAGFLGAVTTGLGEPLPWGSVSFDSNAYALPRTSTGDVAAEQLIELIDHRLG